MHENAIDVAESRALDTKLTSFEVSRALDINLIKVVQPQIRPDP